MLDDLFIIFLRRMDVVGIKHAERTRGWLGRQSPLSKIV